MSDTKTSPERSQRDRRTLMASFLNSIESASETKTETPVSNPFLTEESITFGKHQGSTLSKMLHSDWKYCKWLVLQPWFKENHKYLYNRILEYKPRLFFTSLPHLDIEENKNISVPDFFSRYEFFNLVPIEELKIELSPEDKACYTYYLKVIQSLKDRILIRVEEKEENPYNIKAPNGWLLLFEKQTGLKRDAFKDFITAYDIPNLPYIVEDIKRMGGIEYKGAKSFIIAKKRSESQEKFWEDKLKEKYGEDIGCQFKFKTCIFDMINISNRVLYECKLGLKDLNEVQYQKYRSIVGTSYRMIYLIGCDCVMDMERQLLITTDAKKYTKYISKIPSMKIISEFNQFLLTFAIKEVSDDELYTYI